jgi:predicted nucleotidyltransferase
MSVLSYLNYKASSAVLSNIEKSNIQTSISTLKSRLGMHFNYGVVTEQHLFGSFTRETILPRFMDEHSDIDYMIVFSDNNLKPQAYLDRLKRFAESRYSTSEIYQSNPTLVLELNHIKFDLVPAIRDWYGGLQIPDGPSAWKYTSPNDFNSKLESANKQNAYLIKPTARLLKYWNARSGYIFESFGLEKWLADQFFWFASNQKDYLFSAIENLNTSFSYPKKTNDEINRAKKIIQEVKANEGLYPAWAETNIKKLFREG